MARFKLRFAPTPDPRTKRRSVAKPEGEDSFDRFCKDLRATLHMTQAQLGAWFAVSGKTFARWEDGVAIPTRLQVPGVIAALQAQAPEHAERASLTLGVELPAPAPPSAAGAAAPAAPAIASPAVAKVALEGALFEAAERLGVPSARTREVAVLLFERAALLGLGVSEAAAMLRGGGTGAT